MSAIASPRNSIPGDSSILAAGNKVSTNREQSWYQKLVRSGSQHQPPAEEPLQQTQVPFLSPQRIQLQMQLQREYQQQQELQKNCRQDWWQKKCGSSPAIGLPPVPGYTTPSPAPKFYGTPQLQYEAPYFHDTPHPSLQQRVLMSQHSPMSGYLAQPAPGDRLRMEMASRLPGIERDWLEQEKLHEREMMIKAAHMIKYDAEKRMRETQREMASTINEQETVQMKILQLLKEHELAKQYKASSQITRTPRPPQPPTYAQSCNADLQHKIARLIEAYRQLPKQLLAAAHQKNWQDQVAAYNNMLQAYGQGNLDQSYQHAKHLLQQLLQKEADSPHYSFAPGFYSPHVQQPAHNHREHLLKQQQAYSAAPGGQQIFRTPFPHQQPVRIRRDPRLNQSSLSYQSQDLNVTPRLNQSCQYSEQDITQEIIYQGEKTTSKPANPKLVNSTPRKQPGNQKSFEDENGNMLSRKEDKQEADMTKHGKSPKRSTPKSDANKPKQKQNKESGEVVTRVTFAEKANQEASESHLDTTGRSALKGYVHDWKQLEQRSQHHRRRRRSHGMEQGKEESADQQKNEEDKKIKGKLAVSPKHSSTVHAQSVPDESKDKKSPPKPNSTSEGKQGEKLQASLQKVQGHESAKQKSSTLSLELSVEAQTGKTTPNTHAVIAPSAMKPSVSSPLQTEEENKGAKTEPKKKPAATVHIQAKENTSASGHDEKKKKPVEVKKQTSEQETQKTQDATSAKSAPSLSSLPKTSQPSAPALVAAQAHDPSEAQAELQSELSVQDSKQGSSRGQQSKPVKEQMSKESCHGTPVHSKGLQNTGSNRSSQQPPKSKQPKQGQRKEFRGGSKSLGSSPSAKPVESKSPEGTSSKQSADSSPKGLSMSNSTAENLSSPKQRAAQSHNHGKVRSPNRTSVNPKQVSVRPNPDYSSKPETSHSEYRQQRQRNWRRSTGQRDIKLYHHDDHGKADSMPHARKRRSWEHNRSRDQEQGWKRSSPKSRQDRGSSDNWGHRSRRRSWQWDDAKVTPAKKMKAHGQRVGNFVSPKASSPKDLCPEKSADQKKEAQTSLPTSKAEQSSEVKSMQPRPAKVEKTKESTPKSIPSSPAENFHTSGMTDSETKETYTSGLQYGEDGTCLEKIPPKPEIRDSAEVEDKGREIKEENESVGKKTSRGQAEKSEQPLEEKPESHLEHVLSVLAGMKDRELLDEDVGCDESSDGSTDAPVTAEDGASSSIASNVPMQKDKPVTVPDSSSGTSSPKLAEVTDTSESPLDTTSKEEIQSGESAINTSRPENTHDDLQTAKERPKQQELTDNQETVDHEDRAKAASNKSDITNNSEQTHFNESPSKANLQTAESDCSDGVLLLSAKPGTFHEAFTEECQEAVCIHASEEPFPEELASSEGKEEEEEIIICGEITGIITPEPVAAASEVLFSLEDHTGETADQREIRDNKHDAAGQMHQSGCCMAQQRCQDPVFTNDYMPSGTVLIDRMTANGII